MTTSSSDQGNRFVSMCGVDQASYHILWIWRNMTGMVFAIARISNASTESGSSKAGVQESLIGAGTSDARATTSLITWARVWRKSFTVAWRRGKNQPSEVTT